MASVWAVGLQPLLQTENYRCRTLRYQPIAAKVKACRGKRTTGVRICPKPCVCDFRLGAQELHTEYEVIAESDRRQFRVKQPIAVTDQCGKTILAFISLECAVVEQFLKRRHRGNLFWRLTTRSAAAALAELSVSEAQNGPRSGCSDWFGLLVRAGRVWPRTRKRSRPSRKQLTNRYSDLRDLTYEFVNIS
jgi:hypothetical protein